MDELDDARRDYLALRERSRGALLATIAEETMPSASYAPLVWFDGRCYLFLSDLAGHTGNLKRCPLISLMLIEDEDLASNAFARRRITLQGSVSIIKRDDAAFQPVMTEFQRCFGKVMSIIEPLSDFHLFQLQLESGRFVRGFGQAYELSGESLQHLTHIGAS